jgi:hypothetical protein
MEDILFTTSFYCQEMPIDTTWNINTLDYVTNYYVFRIALPERISIS